MGTTRGRLLNDQVREMLRVFGRAISDAIAESPEATASLARLRAEGYTLHVALDCVPRVDEPRTDEPRARGPQARVPSEPPTRSTRAAAKRGPATPAVAAAPRLPPHPSFRINSDDLNFLRSCGIDPTRRQRKPRG